ncbi:MAG: CDP-archaeol synthase [Nanoarchaeota archaeon]
MVIEDILLVYLILSVILSVFFAQIFKFLVSFFKENKFIISKLWDTGGMPSSHSSLASSLILGVYLIDGFSLLFIVTFFICSVIVRDAFGIRKDVSDQAVILNKIIVDLKLKKRLNLLKLKELVGHSFVQVIFGLISGIVITLIVFNINLIIEYFINFNYIIILISLYFVLPGLISNMMPIFVKNKFKFLKIPVDFYYKFNNKRIFGNHKTVRGFVFGIIGGMFVGLVQYLISNFEIIQKISYIDYTLFNSLFIGFLFAFAALFGDAIESFIKRQININPGKPFIPFDQIDFILAIILFAYFIKPLSIEMIIVLLLIVPFLSVFTTKLGYLLKFRNENW